MEITKYRTELVREAAFNYAGDNAADPDAVYDILKSVFNAPARLEEHFWQVCIDTNGRCVGLFELATGTQTRCVADVAGLMRNALLTNAFGFIIAHNHPGGDPTPSRDDISTTSRVKQASEIIGVRCYDHIVIGDQYYYSFNQAGLM